MSFACQRDSYLREFSSTITSVKPNVTLKLTTGKVKGYEVTMKDTILFPEGGGQNDDRGTLNGHPVLRITRKGPDAIHFITKKDDDDTAENPFQIGDEVKQSLDWNRRFDHMQQHSGQHLISDLFEYGKLKMPTTAWWLAENDASGVGFSYVELEGENIDLSALEELEDEANQHIRSSRDVKVEMFELNDPNLAKATTRGLPDDVTGPIRVITMLNRSNMCCGTHVKNLSELQVIKLLHSEKSKKKGRTLVYFLVGNRVIKYLSDMAVRERKLTELLKNNPKEHAHLVEKAINSNKSNSKTVQILLRESAIYEAEKIKSSSMPKYYNCYKKEGDSDFIGAFVNEFVDHKDEILLFIVTGDDKDGPCQMVLYGNSDSIKDLGPKLLKLLDGKGGGKGTRFNAKINSLKKLKEAQDLVKSHFENVKED